MNMVYLLQDKVSLHRGVARMQKYYDVPDL